MPRPLFQDEPTTDFVTKWDRKQDEVFLRRLQEARAQAIRDAEKAREAEKKPPTTLVQWDPHDCL